MVNVVIKFIFSVLVAALLTSFVSSQIILSELEGFGLSVSLSDRITVTITDLVSLGITLVVLIAPGFLLGFTIAKYAHRFIGGHRKLWYAIAGFSSFPATLYLIKYFMGVTLLASARTPWGMLMTGFCCMIASWLFANLTSVSDLDGDSNEK